jgi:RimJ/RimL family protein N-acetyltransferase
VFSTRELDTLSADVDPENAASIRLLQRLGCVRTGSGERTWNVGGVWKDSVYYALSRADRALKVTGQAPA